MDTGLLSSEKITWLRDRYDRYRRGEVSELAICGEMVQVYAGLPVNSLREAAHSFFAEQIEPHLFPAMQEVVASLQRMGTEIWAVSSTCNWVIEEGVRRFGIPSRRVLAACVAEHQGLATDKLLAVPTDEGKVDALRQVGITRPDAVFGNSVHDAAMLGIARRAFPVNPTEALRARSAVLGWTSFHPSQNAL